MLHPVDGRHLIFAESHLGNDRNNNYHGIDDAESWRLSAARGTNQHNNELSSAVRTKNRNSAPTKPKTINIWGPRITDIGIARGKSYAKRYIGSINIFKQLLWQSKT